MERDASTIEPWRAMFSAESKIIMVIFSVMLHLLVPRKVSTQCSAGKHIITPRRRETHGVKDFLVFYLVCAFVLHFAGKSVFHPFCASNAAAAFHRRPRKEIIICLQKPVRLGEFSSQSITIYSCHKCLKSSFAKVFLTELQ